MNADVAILGTGPSAAFALLACREMGVSTRVLSTTPPSTSQAGAFFLHYVPPAYPAEPVPVVVGAVGHREGYLRKQWGRADIPTSFPSASRIHYWYNSACLEQVWADQPVELVNSLSDGDLARLGQRHGLVFHTFSAKAHFREREIVLFPTLTHFGVPGRDYGTDCVTYNGIPEDAHVRSTMSMGRYSIEFPADTRKEVVDSYRTFFKERPSLVRLRDIRPGTPPVTSGQWLAPNVIPLGRFARFDRNLLSHDAYFSTLYFLKEGVR